MVTQIVLTFKSWYSWTYSTGLKYLFVCQWLVFFAEMVDTLNVSEPRTRHKKPSHSVSLNGGYQASPSFLKKGMVGLHELIDVLKVLPKPCFIKYLWNFLQRCVSTSKVFYDMMVSCLGTYLRLRRAMTG